MWRERLIRLLLVGVGILLLLGIAKAFTGWRAEHPLVGEPLTLPELSIEEIHSEDILGTAREVILGRKKQVDQGDQVNQEGEPITEPVENIQQQTQEVIESIKKLPEDQIEAIKKQIYKEFCEQLLEE